MTVLREDPDTLDLNAVALRAGAGDGEALTHLIKRTSGAIWRACAALVDRESADDLTQETYLRAVRSLHTYRSESAPLPWLLTIARRVCAEEIGRRTRARTATRRLQAETRPQKEEFMLISEVTDAMDRLPSDRRAALLLTAIAGLSYADAAAACGCAVGTIRSRVARARAELIDTLGLARLPESRDATG
ncbi:sigma-70 family RNA polymerase sigma factor [Actinomadura sp. KC216]|uniref:sigma-70 family RNA polymerase sigma factor n=1 Tax=Actinomadura sp. KC216 TaxID=2530370 RepID=UPI0010533CC6|nr:sigma-70 family RNA polymerase sigma factor [Actinomadura sp. KC216]TDB91935.1 sigma-70 family RNA polymerase sigma factor [Actinomadura sp. KC216]